VNVTFVVPQAVPTVAVTTAVPVLVPGVKVARAMPLVVLAVGGLIVPKLVVNVTTVPFATGLLSMSRTVTVIADEPLTMGILVGEAVTVIISVGVCVCVGVAVAVLVGSGTPVGEGVGVPVVTSVGVDVCVTKVYCQTLPPWVPANTVRRDVGVRAKDQILRFPNPSFVAFQEAPPLIDLKTPPP
jgi:hypothetical protein